MSEEQPNNAMIIK